MAKIISTHSFRGGTGKSNTTANLAVLVAKAGHRVGIIDTDIQSPGLHSLFKLKDVFPKSLNDFIWGRCTIEEVAFDITERSIGNIVPDGDRPKLFLIPSSLKISEVTRISRDGFEVSVLNDGLRSLIGRLRLDYLFIDTHSGFQAEALLPISISDTVVIVMRPDQKDLEGTAIAIELARKLEVTDILVLVNKIPPGADIPFIKDQVENLYQAEVGAMLPFSVEMVDNLHGDIFCNRYPDHPLTRQFHAVAQRFLGESTTI